MVGRISLWMGAGVVAAGVSAAALAGAGVAVADDGPGSPSGGGAATSDSPKTTDSQSSSSATPSDEKATTSGAADETDNDKPNPRRHKPARLRVSTARPAAPTTQVVTKKTDKADKVDGQPDHTAVKDPDPVAAATVAMSTSRPTSTPASTPRKPTVVDTVATAVSSAVTTFLKPLAVGTTPVAPDAQPATKLQAAQSISPKPGLINIVGSFAFGLFQAFDSFVAGPPQVPPGSTVRVQRSTLPIDCGPGYTVDADWYFLDTSTSAEPPTRLIYLQHGFPGSAAEYDYTAAELAERNNAIVVATSISGNLFDCYACHLGGDPMHAAVAKLFLGDRADLLASAKAAGFQGDALPERFVLVGHSGGGQLVGGAAGYFEEFAPDAEDHNLVGVILLDTSPIGGAIERGLAKIPDDIPVYTISAAPNFLNSQGAMNRALVAARPGQFVGVELVNGEHSDAVQTHNPLVQIGGQIAGLGFSRPENVQAVQVITQGWINDFYEDTHTGVYGALGSTVDIPGTGGARAYVLPTVAPKLTIIDLIVDAALRSTLLLKNVAYCAEDPSATFHVAGAAANPDLTQNSTANTALSLDGKDSTGQSVGQQCVHEVR